MFVTRLRETEHMIIISIVFRSMRNVYVFFFTRENIRKEITHK